MHLCPKGAHGADSGIGRSESGARNVSRTCRAGSNVETRQKSTVFCVTLDRRIPLTRTFHDPLHGTRREVGRREDLEQSHGYSAVLESVKRALRERPSGHCDRLFFRVQVNKALPESAAIVAIGHLLAAKPGLTNYL